MHFTAPLTLLLALAAPIIAVPAAEPVALTVTLPASADLSALSLPVEARGVTGTVRFGGRTGGRPGRTGGVRQHCVACSGGRKNCKTVDCNKLADKWSKLFEQAAKEAAEKKKQTDLQIQHKKE